MTTTDTTPIKRQARDLAWTSFERGVLVALGQERATESEERYLRGLHARLSPGPAERRAGWRRWFGFLGVWA